MRATVSICLTLMVFAWSRPLQAQSSTCAPSAPPRAVTFYIFAHPDDWQLFMNPNAYNDARQNDVKVVFVYLLAGDGGNGPDKFGKGTIAYYRAREIAAEASTRFIAGSGCLDERSAKFEINERRLRRFEYGRTVSYFLRLPDGGTGDGHRRTKWQSLRKLLDEDQEIEAVDRSAKYRRSDLVATLAKIVSRERGRASKVWFNRPETITDFSLLPKLARDDSDSRLRCGDQTVAPRCPEVLPGDHADHVAAGRMAELVAEHAEVGRCVNQALFVGYQSKCLKENLTGTQADIECRTFKKVTDVRASYGYTSTWNASHRNYLERRYVSRRCECTPGATKCDPTVAE